MKTLAYITLGIASLLTFSEGTDGMPTIFNIVGIASLVALATLMSKDKNLKRYTDDN